LPSSDLKDNSKKKVGFIVNPIAGMGGAVGLKGTDGKEILEKAVTLGATPVAPARAETFLSELKTSNEDMRLMVGAGSMGENEARNHNFDYKVFGEQKKDTCPEDTVEITKRIAKEGVDLLIFCGGDGTARDVLNAVDMQLPVLGVPTGVKMHSAVFAVDPKAAARITLRFLRKQLPLWEAEVMDIDEEAFRQGRLSARLHGYLLSPYEPSLIQGAKMASPMTESELRNQAAIAIYVTESMKRDVVYVVKQILEAIEGKDSKIVVTPIGGQGFIFGRGNQQISPEVIRKVGKDNIIVVATENKMKNLKRLKVDTGDTKLDASFRGTINVVTDYKVKQTVPIE